METVPPRLSRAVPDRPAYAVALLFVVFPHHTIAQSGPSGSTAHRGATAPSASGELPGFGAVRACALALVAALRQHRRILLG